MADRDELIGEVRELRLVAARLAVTTENMARAIEDGARRAAENAREIADIKTQLAVISAMAKATEKAEGKTRSSLSTWLTVIGMIAGWVIAGVTALYAVLSGPPAPK